MALEFRTSGVYLYEKERIGDKVRSVYAGKGEIALMLHWLSKDRKEQDNLEKQRKNKEKLEIIEKENEIESILKEFAEMSKILTDAFFLSNGFHQHKRQWRRKRDVRK